MIRLPIASSRPLKMIQRMLTMKDTVPPSLRTSFPKGKKDSPESLKHWIPIGMPTIVMHQRRPAMIQARPLRKPPRMNQRMFPKNPML